MKHLLIMKKRWIEPSKVLKKNDQFYYMKNGKLSLLKKGRSEKMSKSKKMLSILIA